MKYKMLRVSRAKDAPEEFIKDKKNKKVNEKDNFDDIGVGSDKDMKNYNPNLKIRR